MGFTQFPAGVSEWSAWTSTDQETNLVRSNKQRKPQVRKGIPTQKVSQRFGISGGFSRFVRFCLAGGITSELYLGLASGLTSAFRSERQYQIEPGRFTAVSVSGMILSTAIVFTSTSVFSLSPISCYMFVVLILPVVDDVLFSRYVFR